MRGDPERAIAVLERGLAVARMADIPLLFPFVAAPLGAAYALVGRVGDGLPLLEPGVRQAVSMNLQANHALRLTWLGEALLLGGQIERAARAGDGGARLRRAPGRAG